VDYCTAIGMTSFWGIIMFEFRNASEVAVMIALKKNFR
jgi:hypothetical protein